MSEEKKETHDEVKKEEKTANQGENKQKDSEDKQTESNDNKKPLRPGLTVKVHQKIKEANAKGEVKERIQVFEGRIIALKHGNEAGATITVRKVSEGVGVEKIFPIHSPNIDKIEIVKEAKVRRSKLYFLRKYKKRLKETLLGR